MSKIFEMVFRENQFSLQNSTVTCTVQYVCVRCAVFDVQNVQYSNFIVAFDSTRNAVFFSSILSQCTRFKEVRIYFSLQQRSIREVVERKKCASAYRLICKCDLKRQSFISCASPLRRQMFVRA